MKQVFFIVLFLSFLVTSCTQNKSTKTGRSSDTLLTETPGEVVSSTEKECYSGVVGRDSVSFEMNREGDQFKGFLFYNRYETDSSIGEYNGTISGDTIKGVFDFMSEGMISKIDKYFLVRDGKLLEAIGALKDGDNEYTLVFENPAELKYGESYILEKIDCPAELISEKDKRIYYNLK